ncbi:MAG: DUF108 domain-containing protein [Candidatus Omnitrophica bacterium]|nr:DUF108 domain-containing protein [Candidatus Omnitrophota bacterium]
MIRIGIVGCGTIGTALAKAIQQKFHKFASLFYIADISPLQIKKFLKKVRTKHLQTVSLSELVSKSDFIVETASVQAACEIIPKVLKAGKDILTLSVGGILKVQNLKRLLARSRGHIYIPSGGISGIDAVLAAKVGQIRSVQITTRKPLRSFRDAPYFFKNGIRLRKIRKPTLIFQGNAEKAIRNFPENVNVAVTLSLAGIGPRKTKVRVFTSPTYRYNMHEIKIEGRFGQVVSKVINLPSKENPKTSALAVGSAIATLEKIFAKMKVGT